jgi:polygalacturonase
MSLSPLLQELLLTEMGQCIGMALGRTVVCQSKLQELRVKIVDTKETRPNHFIQVKMTGGSVIKNLHIQNWPVHGFSLSSCSDLTIRDIVMDNSAGDAPNNRSGTKAAAHNSDGLGVGTQSKNILITNITVHNQDDCVAVTSANNVTVSNMYCYGSHGLSIGSIGGKTYNNVTNILVS